MFAAAVVLFATAAALAIRGLYAPAGPATFSAQAMRNWRNYGGDWSFDDGIYSDMMSGRGDKSLVGSAALGDYSVSSDLRFNSPPADTEYGDAGLLLRALDPAIGVDSYRGYYGALRVNDHMLLIGSSDYTWQELASIRFPEKIRQGDWYHIEFTARGCTFKLSAQDTVTGESAELSYVQPNCTPRAGQVGLRSYYAQASWKDFHVKQLSESR